MQPMRFSGLITGLICLLTGISIISWTRHQPPDAGREPDRMNLALRETAHQLLLAAGDSTSTIPSVRTTAPHTYEIQMPQHFIYDRLPPILQAALVRQDIYVDYEVMVRPCNETAVILGYMYQIHGDTLSVPCVGREQAAGCYELSVRLRYPAPHRDWLLALGMAGFLLGGGIIWKYLSRRTPAREAHAAALAPELIPIGKFRLDTANQQLILGTGQQPLTYREAKLLHYLARHPHVLLERARILRDVWEDEGIIVDRSLDVFISRLRKLLRADTGVRIVAVRGVGYRLEIVAGHQA